jgi:hypothetical protein
VTKTQTKQDVGDALNILLQRMRSLEAKVAGPDVMDNTDDTAVQEDELADLINTYLNTTIISPILPAPGQDATNPLKLTTGAYVDDIFIDVEWSAPADLSAATYEVEMAKQTAPGVFALADLKVVGGTTVRFRALEPNTTYGFRVTAVNFYGLRAGPTPATYQTVVSTHDTGVPPQVTGVIIARGATSVVVKFTPLSAAQAIDVANGRGEYQIQISTDNTFATVLGDVFTNDQIYAFDGIIGENTYYARARAIDDSGNLGAWSAVAGPALAGSVNDSMIVADLNAAKITAGFLSASRIQTGSLAADKLTAGTLGVGADIGIGNGSIRVGNPPANGLWINSQGLRCYSANNVVFALDSNGTATFSGTVSGANITATSTIQGSLISGAQISGGWIDIGGMDATSFHVDINGNMWMGASTLSAAPFSVDSAGNVLTKSLKTGTSGAHIEIPSPGDQIKFYDSGGVLGGGLYAYFDGTYRRLHYTGTVFSVTTALAIQADFGTYRPYYSIDFDYLGPSTPIMGFGSSFHMSRFRGMLDVVGSMTAQQVTTDGTITSNGNLGMAPGASIYANTIAATTVDVGSGVLSGSQGGSQRAAALRTRNGAHTVHWDYNGTSLICYVDGIAGFGWAGGLSKAFIINHPSDRKKYLVHACLEGPENGVYYRGKAQLEEDGTAIVFLPDYFEDLTKKEGRSVQLTAAATHRLSSPLSATEPANGQFMVVGDSKSKQSFWWEVKAVRKDLPPLLVEPDRDEVDVFGDGPYRYYRLKEHV